MSTADRSNWYRRTWLYFTIPATTTDEQLEAMLRSAGLNVTSADFNIKRTYHAVGRGELPYSSGKANVILAVPREVIANLVNEKLSGLALNCEPAALTKPDLKTQSIQSAAGDNNWPPPDVEKVYA